MKPHFINRITMMAMLVGIAGFLSFVTGPATAAQQGQIRLGDDYSFTRAPAGSGFRWCEESCRNDPRCKSWTYIKPNRQCRLKHSVAPAVANDCCVSGVRQTRQRDTRQLRCADYARTAVEEQDQNLSNRCGFRGARWNGDYKSHYRWCLNTQRRVRQTERTARKNALNRCEDNRRRVDFQCDAYAQTAVEQNNSNKANRCGFTRQTRWHSDYQRHYDWCLNRSKAERDEENDKKSGFISACLARGGGAYNKDCDTYATDAINQFKDAKKSNCGFTGSRWSNRFRDHYQYCLKVGNWERRSENRTRTENIENCVAQRGGGNLGQMACDHFARVASEQTNSNKKFNCQLRGENWNRGYDANLDWCRRVGKPARDARFRTHEEELDKCIARGGGPFDVNCHGLAERAVLVQKKNVARNCGLRGEGWHEDYIAHYKQCRQVSYRRFKRRMKRRQRNLRTCKFGIRLPFGRR